jgi:hypothetical protein
MADEVKGLIGGIRLAYGAVGVVTTVVALATDRVVAILNVFGIAGVVMLVVGIGTWNSMEAGQPYQRVKWSAIAMGAAGLVAAFLMAVGRPMDENEKSFGILTFIGVANVIVFAGLLSLGLSYAQAAKRKTCPDCANQVLAAARKCQYCGYLFSEA